METFECFCMISPLQVLERMRPIEHKIQSHVEKLILFASGATNSNVSVCSFFSTQDSVVFFSSRLFDSKEYWSD